MGYYSNLASAIYNDIVSGLKGMHSASLVSIEQLEDDCNDERLQIIKEYALKGVLPKNDLIMALNCIHVDCNDLEQCGCLSSYSGDSIVHFEVPQILFDFGELSIDYLGTVDRRMSFTCYTSSQIWQYHKYRKRGKNKPFVYLNPAPNKNNMIDGYIFNAPLIKQVSISAIFKDPRQVEEFGCCENIENYSFLNNEIKRRLTEKKIRYYRQFAAPITPNTQQP